MHGSCPPLGGGTRQEGWGGRPGQRSEKAHAHRSVGEGGGEEGKKAGGRVGEYVRK